MDINKDTLAAIAAALQQQTPTAPTEPVVISHIEVAKASDQHWLVGFCAELGANVRLNQAAVDAIAASPDARLGDETKVVSEKLTTKRIHGVAVRARVGAVRNDDSGRKTAPMTEFIELIKTGVVVPAKFAF